MADDFINTEVNQMKYRRGSSFAGKVHASRHSMARLLKFERYILETMIALDLKGDWRPGFQAINRLTK